MMLVQVIGQVKIHILASESFAAAGFGEFISPRKASKNHSSIKNNKSEEEVIMGSE